MLEKVYELRSEALDNKVREKLDENKEVFKLIEKDKLKEKIKENSIKMELENLLRSMDENNSIKLSIIMEEMYKQGFIDGSNLMLDCFKES